MRSHHITGTVFWASLLGSAVASAADSNPDSPSNLFPFLVTWGPFLIFIIVWFFVMRRMRFNQPWDQITKRLEGIENQLGRIANILERRDK